MTVVAAARAGSGFEDRELRLALVMTGGVSLAVWMGGVSAEIYRASKQEGLYADLCRLTGTRLAIDVISGSSAGGLNGALLGTAVYRDISATAFAEVRNLWLDTGSFAQLLRDPRSKNPPSLLRGDDYFTGAIGGVLKNWMEEGAGRRDPLRSGDLTVILTGSLLTPGSRSFKDDFGAPVIEPSVRARFTFGVRAFTESRLAERLALAARTSASFPGAFEPSFVPVNDRSAPDRPDMAMVADFAVSRWMVDGGVLMNEPVGPALDAIEKRRADRDVRRVLAYVNPNPAPPTDDVPDDPTSPPPLSTVLVKSLITLPRSESIACDIDRLRDRNRRVGARRRTRDNLVWGGWILPTTPPGSVATDPIVVRWRIRSLAEDLYPLWVRRRHEDAARSRLRAHLDAKALDWPTPIASGAQGTYGDLLGAMVQARVAVGWTPPGPPMATNGASEQRNLLGDDAVWRYAFTPLEYFADLALDLVRRTYSLLPKTGDDVSGHLWEQLGDVRAAVHRERAWMRYLRECDDQYYAYWLAHPADLGVGLCVADVATALYERWPTPPPGMTKIPSDGATQDLEGRVCWAAMQLLVERKDVAIPPPSADDLLRTLGSLAAWQFRGPELAELQTVLRQAEMRIARRLAGALGKLGPVLLEAVEIHLKTYAPPSTSDGPVCPPVDEPWEPAMLRQTASVLGLPQGRADLTADIEAALLVDAFSTFVVHTMTSGENVDDDVSRIEFVQVSATLPVVADDRQRSAEEKVAGLKLAHFGAFLKESWRANDWMWGALDGAGRLVPILLDPSRLRQLFFTPETAIDGVRAVVTASGQTDLTSADRNFLAKHWDQAEPEVTAELAYLDARSGLPVPARLDATERAITRTLQLLIASRELPDVADAVMRSSGAGGALDTSAAIFTERVKMALPTTGPRRIALTEVAEVLGSCKVGAETVDAELTSNLGAVTATKAGAVASGLAAGSKSGLGPVRRMAATIRAALLGAYYVALTAVKRGRAAFAIITLLLAVAAGAISARLLGANVPNSVLIVAIGALAFWLVLTAVTARAWPLAIGGAIVLGLIALALIDQNDVCTVFASTCPKATQLQPGWKGTTAWLVPIVLVGAALLTLLWAIRRLARAAGRSLPEVDRADDGRGPRYGWKVVWPFLVAIALAGAAAATYVAVHDWLFTGDGTTGARRWVIERLEGWSGAGVLVVVVGLPALVVALAYGREIVQELNAARTKRRAQRAIAAGKAST